MSEARRTRIVATLGEVRPDGILDSAGNLIPGSSPARYWDRFLRGLTQDPGYPRIDLIRFNMSFFAPGRTGPHYRILDWLSRNRNRAGNIALLADLPGPKLRLRGTNPEGFETRKGQLVRLGLEKGAPNTLGYIALHNRPLKAQIPHSAFRIPHSRNVVLSIGDGQVVLELVKAMRDALECRVRSPGRIYPGKGVSFSGLELDLPAFAGPDKRALDFLLDRAIDWREDFEDPASLGSFLAFIGVSFVRTAQDVRAVRNYLRQGIRDRLKRHGPNRSELNRAIDLACPGIIAKIETRAGAENVREILAQADGIMVARGDLALQIGPDQVPAAQKEIIRLCNQAGKPVITATEMLASMQENPEPTRAEAADVFNAVLDGTDAVMLSGETSQGRYPFQAIEMMDRIARAAEQYRAQNGFLPVPATGNPDPSESLALSANMIAHDNSEYRAIVAVTGSGRTARLIARFRPGLPVIGLTNHALTRRKLLVSAGIVPVHCRPDLRDVAGLLDSICRTRPGLVRTGDKVVVLSGTPFFKPGSTDTILVRRI